MDLQKVAETEQARRTRGSLEPHRGAILALRRKHWTYGQIARWLNEHGVSTTLSSVHRFCQRALSRRPGASNPLPVLKSEPLSVSPSTPPTPQPRKYRFNLDI